MKTAFKDWAIIVDALGRGSQIIILRKGGISEGKGGFKMEHQRFWLFPTLYHQQRASVIPSAQIQFDSLPDAYRNPSVVRIQFVAETIESLKVDHLQAAHRLRDQHIWRDEVIAERFEWGREQSIFAIAVRVLALPTPIDLPTHDVYGGCKSWIELEEDLDPGLAKQVLTDSELESKLQAFRSALKGSPHHL